MLNRLQRFALEQENFRFPAWLVWMRISEPLSTWCANKQRHSDRQTLTGRTEEQWRHSRLHIVKQTTTMPACMPASLPDNQNSRLCHFLFRRLITQTATRLVLLRSRANSAASLFARTNGVHLHLLEYGSINQCKLFETVSSGLGHPHLR